MSRRSVTLLALLIVAVVALTAWRTQANNNDLPLDPESASPDGTRAVVEVLQRNGIDVAIARTEQQLIEAQPASNFTIVVSDPEVLGSSGVQTLRNQGADRLIYLGMPLSLSRFLSYRPGEPLTPGSIPNTQCRGSAVPELANLSLITRAQQGYPTRSGCFQIDDQWLIAAPEPDTVIMGAPDALTNTTITAGDNAAIALRLLGQHSQLIWYVPDPRDVLPSQRLGVQGEIPLWLTPSLGLTVVAVFIVLWWRGRRLGSLVREPLPVEIPGLETVLSRGHLYFAARDFGHVAETLQHASKTRIAKQLNHTDLDHDLLLALIAAQVGSAPSEIATLLFQPPRPTSHTELVRFATALRNLEEKVGLNARPLR
jgi:hypothetical protein